MILDDLIREVGPIDITIWITPKYTQANTRMPGSDGWSCHTADDPVTALREALEGRLPAGSKSSDAEIDDLI